MLFVKERRGTKRSDDAKSHVFRVLINDHKNSV
jgi:hypothetical protein